MFASLLLGFLIVAAADVVVAKLVRVLRCGNNAHVVLQLLLLQVTLRQVLQLTLGEAKLGRGRDSQLCAVAGDHNTGVSELTGLSGDLDALMEVLLEVSNIQDAIIDRLCAINDELDSGFLSFDLQKRNDRR